MVPRVLNHWSLALGPWLLVLGSWSLALGPKVWTSQSWWGILGTYYFVAPNFFLNLTHPPRQEHMSAFDGHLRKYIGNVTISTAQYLHNMCNLIAHVVQII
jgi:hypothetical protein